MATKKTLTYGTLPTREKFEAAFEQVVGEKCGICKDKWPCATAKMSGGLHYPDTLFSFRNDPRVGTCELTCNELWRELVRAQKEWVDLPCDCGKGDGNHDGNEGCTPQDAGQWCSDVLGVLGFEWE